MLRGSSILAIEPEPIIRSAKDIICATVKTYLVSRTYGAGRRIVLKNLKNSLSLSILSAKRLVIMTFPLPFHLVRGNSIIQCRIQGIKYLVVIENSCIWITNILFFCVSIIKWHVFEICLIKFWKEVASQPLEVSFTHLSSTLRLAIFPSNSNS